MSKLLINPAEAANFLGVKTGTLAIWRCYKKGPRYRKIQGKVWYTLADLEEFINSSVMETLDSRSPQLRPIKSQANKLGGRHE